MKHKLNSMIISTRLSVLAMFACTACIVFCNGCKKDFTEKTNVQQNSNSRTASKPNIVIIMADDLGYEIPSFTGGQSYNTPSLDFMARNGMQFVQMYNHPDGFPSRLALYTGKYNFRNYKRWGLIQYGDKTVGNMLQDAGYSTCFVGKWQCDGGDTGIHRNGFQDYLVYLPYAGNQRLGRYKNPIIYGQGAYLSDSAVAGKYSEDMFFDHLSQFIDSNKTKPFFAIYANVLPAQPWVPTPDDPAYANWNPARDTKDDDIKYFPGMIQYLDKKVGQVLSKLRSAGVLSNTIVMFVSDNATDKRITSMFRGVSVSGGKTQTNRSGTTNAMVAYWPGHIPGGTTSKTLADYTDFLPTLADIAGIPVPLNYGILDGTSFYDDLLNIQGPDRDWVFCHWDNNLEDTTIAQRYVNDRTYKLYDSIDGGHFYNISKDIFETQPIPDNLLTPAEKNKKMQFMSVLQQMHN